MEKQYRLVFKGELLPGLDPALVRERASQRLGANTQQTERLFSGQAVILKRGLSIEAVARYARELRLLGMRMHVELDTGAPAKVAHVTDRRIVFRGELVAGFAPQDVMRVARERLHATPEQVSMLFSGRTTTLKKGLDAEGALRYASRLFDIGMRVAIETDASRAPQTVPATAASDASHVATEIHASVLRTSEACEDRLPPVDMDFTQTMVDHELIATHAQNALPDMEKTEIAGEASLQAYMREEYSPVAPVVQSSPALSSAFVLPNISVVRYAVTAEVPQPSAASLPPRSCTSCGARQVQGRYCIHCGHEFPRDRALRPATPAQSENLRAEPTHHALFSAAQPVDTPPGNANMLYLGLVVAGLALLAAWLSMR